MGHNAHVQDQLKGAVDLLQQSQPGIAETIFRAVLDVAPNEPIALHFLGMSLHQQGRRAEAMPWLFKSIKRAPTNARFQNNVAKCFLDCGRFDDALLHARRATALDPKIAAGHFNAGMAYSRLNNLPEALKNYRNALPLGFPENECVAAICDTLLRLGDFSEALHVAQNALVNHPKDDGVRYYYCLGLFATGEISAGHQFVNELLQQVTSDQRPSASEYVLVAPGRALAAIQALRVALQHKPGDLQLSQHFIHAATNLGHLSAEIAKDHFKLALANIRDWHGLATYILFNLQYSAMVSDTELFGLHKQFGEALESSVPNRSVPVRLTGTPEKRLRIGYVSGDFWTHSVANFVLPILRNHDKRQFEIFCYHTGQKRDATTGQIQQLADCWQVCSGDSDDALAARVDADGIDVLVDLSGHTTHNRLGVFARKPAPIQMTWIGYAGTTGLSTMDYRITDNHLDPPGLTESQHTERLIRLNGVGAPFLPDPASPAINALPALHGQGFTFASLNNPAKLNPGVIDAWAEILLRVPRSRILIVNADNFEVSKPLVDQLVSHSIDRERIELLPWLDLPAFLALHHQIDLALDPFPYNGGTTTCHSLWMGVPVVTLAGTRTVSRVGATLLNAAQLSDFITYSVSEYVNKAVSASNDLQGLAQIRQSLRRRITDNPAWDPVAITRELEQAYRNAWKERVSGPQ